MSEAKEPTKVKLITGIMYADEKLLIYALEKLKTKFGDFKQGPTINFNFTNYYEEETGKNLKKTYVAFNRSIKREELSTIKLWTNQIEQEFCVNKKRKINIDPGYMSPIQIILASAKEHPQRTYISDGIYGQIILIYMRNEWNAVEKTFADYKEKEVREFLLQIRDSLVASSKSL